MAESPTAEIHLKQHFGVYGAFLERGRILAVRKTRGPYTGRLDLPGGSPEAGEDHRATLERELAEETGGRLIVIGNWQTLDVHVAKDSAGEPISFHHTGVWCPVLLADIDFDLPPHEDVAGIEWVPLDGWVERTDLSDALRAVLDIVTC
jgi:8-oxo-dGTP pyrophosphatase MutT (NUDIX family)